MALPHRRLAIVVALLVVLATAPAASADIIDPPDTAVPPTPPTAGIGEFHPLSPARILDTRTGLGGISGRFASGSTKTVDVTGVGGVLASGVSAVAMNVTVTGATSNGWLTLFPTGAAKPTASNLNYSAGQTIANMAVVKVGTDGKIKIYAQGATHVILDVVGFYHATKPAADHVGATLYHPLTPKRLVDTRFGTGGVTGPIAHGTFTVDVTRSGAAPTTGATGVALNVTITGATNSGWLTLYPSGTTRPTASNLNYTSGKTLANMAFVKVGADGNIKVYSEGTTHVIVDIVGWFGPDDQVVGGQMSPLTPKRIVDTRTGLGGISGRFATGSTKTIDVTGVGGIPSKGVGAVKLNVTVTGGTTNGYLTIYPSGVARPTVSNINFSVGQTIAAMAVVKTGADGNIKIYSAGTTHVIIDVIGWYTAPGLGVADGAASAAAMLAPTGSATEGSAAPTVKLTDDQLKVLNQTTQTIASNGKTSVSSTMPVDIIDPNVGSDIAGAVPTPKHPYITSGPLFRTDDARYTGGGDLRIGRILNPQGGGSYGTCSGTVVARNLVVTAAHCVTNIGSPGSPGAYLGDFYFTPNQYGAPGDAGYGTWTATQVFAPALYREYGYSAADWAFLVFGNVPANGNVFIGDYTGWFYMHSDPPGGTKYTYGYPSEGTFWSNSQGSCTLEYCLMYTCASRITDTSSQYYLALTDASVSYGGWYEVGFGCFMTGGSSGGPVFENIEGTWYVTGVVSHLQTTADNVYSCTSRPNGCPNWTHNIWSPYFNARIIEQWYALYQP